MITRSKDRFDYKVYHETGSKVSLGGGETGMDPAQVMIRELQIVGVIHHSLALYDLDDLFTEDEISEGIGVMTDLGKNYRHLHVELKSHLQADYEDRYPLYNDFCSKISTYLKSAKAEVRNSKDKVKNDKVSDQKYFIEVEFDILKTKVAQVNDCVDIHVGQNDNDIDRYVTKMEGFVEEFYTLMAKMKYTCPDSITEFEYDFSTCIFEIQQDIKLARLLKQRIKEFKENSEKMLSFQNQQLKSMTSADTLKTEISYRFKSLSKRFDLDLDGLGDHQLLEISQKKDHLHLEFNSILEKITDLSSLVSSGGEKVSSLFEKMCKTRDRLSQKREAFFAKLQKIILERDITADKLKYASELTIELPKFSGYDSKMDFYTFKTEFKKLVEPKVQKKNYADYLKRNYLSGSALILVEKETSYEKIWERLHESYGNSRLLLQNKLSSLDKISLSNAKGDQKIATILASLINTMRDLSTLAKDHDIEGQLYEGGGLEKVMSLIGDHRHRKFRGANLGCPDLSKKQEWQKLKEYLENELKLREKMTLDHKAAEQLGLSLRKDNPGKNEEKGNIGSHNTNMSSGGTACHICGKDGHTVITTR